MIRSSEWTRRGAPPRNERLQDLEAVRLHAANRAEFSAFLAAAPGAPGAADVVLHGPPGVGKTALLRAFFREAFETRGRDVPLFAAIPAAPFHPRGWARRFLLESLQQWAAFARQDAELAGANLLAEDQIAELCWSARLGPLTEIISSQRAALESPLVEDAFALQWTFDALLEAAERLGRRLLLLVDGAENGVWQEDAERFFLASAVAPLEEPERMRRIWTSRFAPGDTHPLLPPAPPSGARWEVEPLAPGAAARFVDALARRAGADYEEPALEEHLALWGGVPLWLANFVRQAAESPRALTTGDQILQAYLDDVRDGPTARRLLHALGASGVEPSVLARCAETHLVWSDGPRAARPAAARAPAPGSPEETALRALAREGLARFDGGRWRVARTPVLADFLELFSARHFRGESPQRAEIALKRRRLVEAPRRMRRREGERRVRHAEMLMQAFQGQNLPAAHFRAHRGEGAAPAPVVSERFAGQAAGLSAARGAAGEGERLRLPFCIGAFACETPAPPAEGAAETPAVAGWCFDEPGYYRSDETLWVVHLSPAKSVTAAEVDEAVRTTERVGRDLDVARTRCWIVSDGRFSEEAAGRIEAGNCLASTWDDFEAIGRALFEGRRTPGPAEPETQEAVEPAGLFREPAPAPEVFGPFVGPKPASAGAPSPEPAEETGEDEPRIHERGGRKEIDLALAVREDAELEAARALDRMGQACGFPSQAVAQMRMALLEACLNAVQRSADAEKRVQVRISGTPEKIVAVVENEGPVFDPQRVEAPDVERKLSDPNPRGWGLKLIEKFTDRVVFEPCETGTRLRLEKCNPNAAHAGAPNA